MSTLPVIPKTYPSTIENATSVAQLEKLQQEVNEWGKCLHSQLSQIPVYDQRSFSLQISHLVSLIEAKKSQFKDTVFKFSQRRKPMAIANVKDTVAAALPQPKPEAEPVLSGRACFKETITTKLQHMYVTDLSQCIISAPGPVGSIHVKNVTQAIVSLVSDGPVFIHDFTDAILIVKCHQLRVHNTKNVKLFMDVGSKRAIIEQCSALTVGSYPGSQNMVEIDDFSWPTKNQANPHYDFSTESPNYNWVDSIGDGSLSPEVVRRLCEAVSPSQPLST